MEHPSVVGLVAEYNPFHRGHGHQLEAVRSLLGPALPVIAVMSGSLTQRGELPLWDKWRRTRLALLGGAALVLEEYEHAVRRGAKIYGEVVGYGATCDAFHITAPRPEGTCGARAIQQALTEAGHQPGEVVYINAHGTGTPMNDSLETKVVKQALREEEAKKAVEAIACLKALNESILPPTINLLAPAPPRDLNNVPNVAIHADVDLVLSNSLGFGGHNACIAFRKVTK